RFLFDLVRAAVRPACAGRTLARWPPPDAFRATFAVRDGDDFARTGFPRLAATRTLLPALRAGAAFARELFAFSSLAGFAASLGGAVLLAGGWAIAFGLAAAFALVAGGAFGLLRGRPPFRAN